MSFITRENKGPLLFSGGKCGRGVGPLDSHDITYRCASSFSFFSPDFVCQDPPGYIPNPRAKGVDKSCLCVLLCFVTLFFVWKGGGDFCDSKKLGDMQFQC